MEGQLKWLDNILSKLDERSEDSKILRVRKLLKGKLVGELEEGEDGGEEEEGGGCHLQNPQYVRSLAGQLNKATLRAFVEDLEEALEHLGKVREELEELAGEHKERFLEVMTYFLEGLEWSISGTEDPDKARILKRKWEEFQDNPKNQAVILYLKANLEQLFHGNDKMLEALREVIMLDPDYHIWSVYAYQVLRHQRRLFNKEEQILKAPSKMEVDFCENAYRLEPNILTTFNLAMMLKDCLWMTVYKNVFKDVQFEECPIDTSVCLERSLKLFDDAIEIAKENDLNDWVLKCTVQKADLLCHQGTDEQRRHQGLHMFLELIESHPDNAYYHQKLGRIYQFGVRGECGRIFLRDVRKAYSHFTQALSLHQRNYCSCLRDYIRLFNYLEPPYPAQEVFELVTESLTTFADLLTPEFLATVRIWRGCLLWIHNPEKKRDFSNKREACLDWLHVLKNNPEYRNLVFKYLWNPQIHVYLKKNGKPWHGPVKICTDELKMELGKLREEDGGFGVAADMILEEIGGNPGNISGLLGAVKLEVGGKENLEISRDGKSPKKKYTPPKKVGKGKCLADQDDNWRR